MQSLGYGMLTSPRLLVSVMLTPPQLFDAKTFMALPDSEDTIEAFGFRSDQVGAGDEQLLLEYGGLCLRIAAAEEVVDDLFGCHRLRNRHLATAVRTYCHLQCCFSILLTLLYSLYSLFSGFTDFFGIFTDFYFTDFRFSCLWSY
jgi:hypothetical protein